MTKANYLDVVNRQVVIFDGAMGTNIQLRGLTAEDFGGSPLEGCNEVLVKTRPDVIADIHKEFLEVGVDVIETDTFGAFSIVLDEYGLGEDAYDLNLRAAKLAVDAATQYSTDEHPRFVAGSVGPGTKAPSIGQISFDELRDSLEDQMRGLIDGGVDVIVIETCYDLLETKAAMHAARNAMEICRRNVALQVQVTIETTGRMLLGTETGAALVALEAMKPDVIGINCATGPYEMGEHIRYLSQTSPLPISVLPNAGMPTIVDGKTVYDLTPEELAEYHSKFITEYGVTIVGGCCGTTPAHLAKVVEACRPLTPAKREPILEPSVASTYAPVTIKQDTSFLVIGEKTNANGSKAFREALLAGDIDTCERIAREQIGEGAHLLDVCVDYVGRDGAVDIDLLMARLATGSTAPVVLDSTEPQVLEAGLKWIGGRAVLNSANLEDGEADGSRLDRVFKLAQKYGAAVICLLIDEEGQARDLEWKMRVARRIHALATEKYGLKSSDLIFDALTFPLTTGEESLRGDAMATINAIKQIKEELPGVQTVLGVSNVSFGLKPAARHILNSVFLFECVNAGMDAAIINAAKIIPMNKINDDHKKIALDLIYDRRSDGYDPLHALIEATSDADDIGAEIDLTTLPIRERLAQRIIDGNRQGLTSDLDELLLEMSALDIVNDVLLSGMKTVGELFATGEMQLPFVLQSAETMKSAVSYLEPKMEKAADGGKGKLVLATVKGDVHDIGKNLVDIILSNNGYDVYNLGIKVGISEMIDEAKRVDADAIGMSGLLVKSTLIMRENLEQLNDQGMSHVPILLGGAALTRRYVEDDLRDVYQGSVYYGKDAFEGLRVMDAISKGEQVLVRERGISSARKLVGEKTEAEPGNYKATAQTYSRSPIVEPADIPKPPFVGTEVVKGIPLDEIAEYLNETALFRHQWGFRPEDGELEAEFKARVRATFREQFSEARESNVLIPQVVYGYFPAHAEGNDVVIFDNENMSNEIERFNFPRQSDEPYLCIADFFTPAGQGVDYACFTIATMGAQVSEKTAQLFAENEYQRYLYLHGLGVELTEALAEMWHARIRKEWGISGSDDPTLSGIFRQHFQGGRYSWGYPACPDLEDNERVANLLDANRIGVTVTDGFQLNPEQTTSAIVCHHPQAKYFVA